ncbi:DsbA family protein [Streptomyces lydicus]|uniref:DsbA family protein n=1 Tax=Streptomyces lydicus TaxID=47763 RepID=UPI001012E55E|nr:thioredoxin domain-containing protein [Streptomyces lydicus]
MSQKNHEGKRTARERMQEQREKEKARARRGRQAVVAGAVVVALAVAGGIAVWATSAGSGKSGSDNETARPKQVGGGSSPAVPVGAPQAPSTLTVWEDFRCPACQQFETGFRPAIHELQDSGQLKNEYHLVTIIDGNAGGKGSLNAANAALCAQDAGKFREYHDVLYSHQPPEEEDKFADKQYLLQLAGKVKGLVTPAFTRCVNDGRYDRFVQKSTDAFARSGYRGTPTVLLNGKDLSKEKGGRFSPADLKKMVQDADKGKQPGKSASPHAGAPPHSGASRHSGASPHPAAPTRGKQALRSTPPQGEHAARNTSPRGEQHGVSSTPGTYRDATPGT